MEDHRYSAVFSRTNRLTALDLRKDFIAEILGSKFLSLGGNENHVKTERRPKYCEHAFRAVDDPLWFCRRPVTGKSSHLFIIDGEIKIRLISSEKAFPSLMLRELQNEFQGDWRFNVFTLLSTG
jgi:hypothetical protein